MKNQVQCTQRRIMAVPMTIQIFVSNRVVQYILVAITANPLSIATNAINCYPRLVGSVGVQ